MASVVTDMVIYILPIPTLRGLNLPRRQRCAVVIVFSLGFVVVLAGSVRLYWVAEVVNNTYDVTWSGFCMWIWTAVEVNLGVMCGCAPTLRPLFKYFHTKIRRVSGAGLSGDKPSRDGCEVAMQPRDRRMREESPWFENLSWIEGSNWLGSLERTNSKATSPDGSVEALGIGGGGGGGGDDDTTIKDDEHREGSMIMRASTMDSDPGGWKTSMAEIS